MNGLKFTKVYGGDVEQIELAVAQFGFACAMESIASHNRAEGRQQSTKEMQNWLIAQQRRHLTPTGKVKREFAREPFALKPAYLLGWQTAFQYQINAGIALWPADAKPCGNGLNIPAFV